MAWNIGEAARRTGLSADTLRYYERIGLLPPPGRSAGHRRVYRERDIGRLHFIRRAQAVGFTLEEIRQLLRFRENPAKSGRAVRELAVGKHRIVRERLELLKQVEAELALLVNLCRGDGDECPIIERLDRED